MSWYTVGVPTYRDAYIKCSDEEATCYSEWTDQSAADNLWLGFWGVKGYSFANPAKVTPMDGAVNYKVLMTDYKDFAVVYRCTDLLWGAMHDYNVQILGRKTTIDGNTMGHIEQYLVDTVGLDAAYLEEMVQPIQGEICNYSQYDNLLADMFQEEDRDGGNYSA